MTRRLFTVKQTFVIDGRGLVLTPGIAPEDGETFSDGDPIQLRAPDGSVKDTVIGSLHLPTPNPNHEVWVMLPSEFDEGDVAIGTEVWSTTPTSAPNTE